MDKGNACAKSPVDGTVIFVYQDFSPEIMLGNVLGAAYMWLKNPKVMGTMFFVGCVLFLLVVNNIDNITHLEPRGPEL